MAPTAVRRLWDSGQLWIRGQTGKGGHPRLALLLDAEGKHPLFEQPQLLTPSDPLLDTQGGRCGMGLLAAAKRF
ncbi:MAG: hypothetical protein HY321_16995 [Armatimonadetes bacterium]|nr:hypothetical protein [Armatimonadota bacterium]